jgi:hypothetical protein
MSLIVRIARRSCTLGVVLLLSACGRWIYDDPPIGMVSGDGYFERVDATSYTGWTYIDLDTRTVTAVEEYAEGNTAQAPTEWHFAMHRFDCKTNGGEVMETAFNSLDALVASGGLPEGEFAPDEWTTDKVAYDLSQMMQSGIIGYAESWYNPVLSRWMNVDISGMPPTYTPSDKVYIIRFPDGKLAAIKFTDFVGPKGVKGYNSFDYIYPLEF